MDIEEEGEVDGEGAEGGNYKPKALVALEFLTQEVELTGTTLVDAHNGLN